MKFGLSADNWSLIEKLLILPLKEKGARIWVFGSRATNKHRPFSDIDILYEANDLLPIGFISQIKENLEESRLPIKADLVDLSQLAETYKDRVMSERIEV